MGGNLETDTDVTLRFTPTFQKIYKLKTGEDLPEFVDFPSSTTAQTLGFGLTTGLQYENLIFTASATYAWALTNETESEINTLILLGMVGYDFGDLGMQVLTGVQYQKTDRMVLGRLYPAERADPVEFGIGIDIEETMFLLGYQQGHRPKLEPQRIWRAQWNPQLLYGRFRLPLVNALRLTRRNSLPPAGRVRNSASSVSFRIRKTPMPPNSRSLSEVSR